MFNSGGKNVFKEISPFKKYREMTRGVEHPAQYPVPELFKYAEPQTQRAIRGINQLGRYLTGPAEAAYQSALRLNQPQNDQDLYDLEARRYTEQVMPKLAAMGLATSGPGIDILRKGIEDLGVKFGERRFERQLSASQLLQQATQGLAIIKSLPIELREKLIAMIIGQGGVVPGVEKSLFEKMFPGGMKDLQSIGSGAITAGAGGAPIG